MRRYLPDLSIAALLLLLPLIMFWQQTIGGRTLLPAENLFQYEPYASYREVARAPELSHNHLLSDLVLQNMQFKHFIREQFAQGEFPLWNPHQFSGIPFFAAGQQSTLYPFSALFYVLDLDAAYGWYTVSQLWLAGLFMAALLRGLGAGRFGGAVAGITYQLSAFFVISAVFPMIIGAAVWLPLVLLMCEYVIRAQPGPRGHPATPLWMAVGAVALGCNVLAGHVEITYYTLLIAAYYAAARLLWQIAANMRRGAALRAAALWALAGGARLIVMVGLGLALGAVQFIPIFEAASGSFRVGSAQFSEVLGWAHPLRDVLQFALPNFYGSPAHHSYVDVFSGQTIPVMVNAVGSAITHTDWGMKNYVEGALYVGILPLALAFYGLIDSLILRRKGAQHAAGSTQSPEPSSRDSEPRTQIIFATLGLLAFTFMFGLPTYALLYYTLPGIDQLHSPFRWVLALTLCVAVLAGFGAERLLAANGERRSSSAARWIGASLSVIGGAALIALVVSRIFYPQVEPLIARVFEGMAKATDAFPDPRAFYSYQFTNILIFGVMSLTSGLILFWFRRASALVIRIAALALIAADLMIASWGFNPTSDPLLLDFRPPAIEWLQGQPGEWRYTTLDVPGRPPLMNANIGMRYGLDDIRGYESIIPRQYVEYMQRIAPQGQLEFNRIAPLYTDDARNHFGGYPAALDSWLFDLLNVRFVVTYPDVIIPFQEWRLAYEDAAVRIWENDSLVPRAFIVRDPSFDPAQAPQQWQPFPYEQVGGIRRVSGRELLIEVEAQAGDWLIVSESFNSGWRAFVRSPGAGEEAEQQSPAECVLENFIGVRLPDAGAWTVRLVYSPTSFQVGAFTSFIGAALVLLLVGVWLWRLYMVVPEGDGGAAARVAKNSIAPIILSLFNRAIDFAFAAVMLRLLGPTDAGLYYYAIIIFGWFDIFSNFGLNLYVMREVARDRAQARHLLINTSVLRLILALVGVPLLIGFLAARQSSGSAPLDANAILAIVLLYIGLLPNSLSTGLTALFYAFERAEIPAAVTTIATICKAAFGLAALLLGFGFVGLAAASILTNIITLLVLAWNGRGMIAPAPGAATAARDISPRLMWNMVGQSYPLMLNHFLASIFFKIDVILIEVIHNATMVGQYSQAYKWVEAINIIPSFFTQALLPLMSRQAHDDRAAFQRTYTLALKLLFSLALPAAVFFTVAAEFLTQVLAGAQYLPDGAIALQLMIWSVPIGWMNSLTQYTLIALDLQRRITWAFLAGVAFNLVTNLIFIPAYGYRAAALTTIASEAVLFIAFAILLHRAGVRTPWLDVVWRPGVAAGVMLLVILIVGSISVFGAVVGAAFTYAGVLIWLRPFSDDEWSRLQPLLPARLRGVRWLAVGR